MLRMVSILALLTFAFGATAALAGNPSIPICTVRADTDGDCVADAAATATEVCVTGVVIAWKQFGARGAGAIYDPTSGCCISIFDIDLADDQPVGTLVEVCGWVGAFSGLDEIIDNPADATMDPTVTVLGVGAAPAPVAIDGAELLDLSPTAEGLESCLVSICGTFETPSGTFGSGSNNNFIAEDGSTVTVRIDNDTDIVGTAVPTGNVTIVGILGQFDGFGANPCGGYQLLPRDVNDLTETDCTPIATQHESWGEVKSRYED